MLGLGTKRNNRVVADYDIGLPDDWYPVDLSPESSAAWVQQLAWDVAPSEDAKAALAGRLTAVVDAVEGLGTPQLTTAVWIPTPATGELASLLTFGLVQLAAGQGPEAYLATLVADEGKSGPGTTFLEVRTWTAQVDAGIAVGAYNRIAHTEPDGQTRVEERTVIGVFPPRSKEMVECIFTAQASDAFDDIVEQTMGLAATISVVLEKG
jgi:hypothetical protein